MSSRTVAVLAAGVVVLFAVMWMLNANDRGGRAADTGLLLPDLKPALNDIHEVTITNAGGSITIRSADGGWIVPDKGGYPAATATLRALLLDLADARKVEEKTSNPEMYTHLGVQDPQEGGEGTLVSLNAGGEEPVSVILGESAQGDYRYARLPAEATSWLIDRDPDVPQAAGAWLAQEIVDIPSARVQGVEIRHEDGETIRLAKASPDENNFTVENVPEGRELSYPSVANPIAGVLSNLTLDDVRQTGDPGEPAATASFATFDGLRIDVHAWTEDGEDDEEPWTWIALQAVADETAVDVAADAGEEPGTGPENDAQADGEAAADAPAGEAAADATGDENDEPGTDEEAGPGPREQAEAINARVSGWQFRIPGYKARQLTRRWDDLLADAED